MKIDDESLPACVKTRRENDDNVLNTVHSMQPLVHSMFMHMCTITNEPMTIKDLSSLIAPRTLPRTPLNDQPPEAERNNKNDSLS